jgi:DNA polymerase-1
MILQVHDELLFEVDPSCVEEFQKDLIETMSSVVDLEVVLEVEVGIGDNWGEAH